MRSLGFCIASTVAMLAFVNGCSSGNSSSLVAEPGFSIPVAGDETKTVLRIGDEFPELTSTDLDGNPVTFDRQLLGDRYTLVVFWSTWCGFCMLELPHEVELAQKYEPLGLRVIGVNADETVETAREAVAEHKVPWLNLYEGPEQTISQRLGIRVWPELFLLDSQGKVVATSDTLRSVSVETLPDGTEQRVDSLEWTLRKLLWNR